MTTRTTTVGQAKQGFRVVLVMTAATAALLGGVMLFQLRPSTDTTAPAQSSTITPVSDGIAPMGGIAERILDEQRAATQAALPRGGMAEFYAELRAGAGTGSVTSVAVGSMRDMEDATTVVPVAVDTLGGMAELYRDQRAAAEQQRTRVECGDGLQPALCY